VVSRDIIDRYLKKIVKEKAILRGNFTLSSGIKTNYYFDGRIVTLSPDGAYLVGKRIFDLVRNLDIDAIGGPVLGAVPIVAAVALISHLEGKPIPAFVVRETIKKHGTQKEVEGNLPKGGKVVIVDDTLTTGRSILRVARVVEKKNCQIVKIIVLVDRQQGGSEELRRRGYDFTAIFRADESGGIYVSDETR
jgi:orotate phosphoribosyltransferase